MKLDTCVLTPSLQVHKTHQHGVTCVLTPSLQVHETYPHGVTCVLTPSLQVHETYPHGVTCVLTPSLQVHETYPHGVTCVLTPSLQVHFLEDTPSGQQLHTTDHQGLGLMLRFPISLAVPRVTCGNAFTVIHGRLNM